MPLYDVSIGFLLIDLTPWEPIEPQHSREPFI